MVWGVIQSLWQKVFPSPTYTDEFQRKIQNVNKHYLQEPETDPTRFGIYKDELDFLALEDVELLAHDYVQRHHHDPRYDTANVKVIENKHDFENLSAYLTQLGKLKAGESVKLIVKMKKGEPAHYAPNLGLHVVAVYIRNEGSKMSAFIMDHAAGVVYEHRDGFNLLTKTIEKYLQSQSPDYRILKSSNIVMAGMKNCKIYALSALHYFIKFGHTLFPELTQHLVDQRLKVVDRDNPRIFHVKADGLPPYLVKMSNRHTFDRVNEAYQHEWMPVKATLTPAYRDKQELLQASKQKPLSYDPKKTLGKYLSYHCETKRRARDGLPFKHNMALDRKTVKAKERIVGILSKHEVITDSTASGNRIDQNQLNALFKKIRR